MQKIIPFLWFDRQAEEAAKFYTSIFNNSKIGRITRYTEVGQEFHGQQPGSVMTVDFELEGFSFGSVNGGPVFKFNPSISFMVSCESKDEVDQLWGKLFEGGKALMELGEYPFSSRYGWLEDKYGLSWQIGFMEGQPVKQKITPTLMFVGSVCGKAEEAAKFYTSLFPNSQVGDAMRYGAGEEPDKEGSVKYMDFTLCGQSFAAMDSAYKHEFAFNEAVSFLVNCEDQEEIDRYWEALLQGEGAGEQQCGWLKDQFGVSWQIAPAQMQKWMDEADPEKSKRMMQAMFGMKKLEIEGLRNA